MRAILLVFLIFMSSSSYAAGRVTFTNGDDSKEAQACIDSVVDKNYVIKKYIVCNGLPISEFSKKYKRQMARGKKKTVRVFKLSASDNNVETNLCIAAATSKQMLKDLVKSTGYKRPSTIRCNGMPIKKFAKKYLNQ